MYYMAIKQQGCEEERKEEKEENKEENTWKASL